MSSARIKSSIVAASKLQCHKSGLCMPYMILRNHLDPKYYIIFFCYFLCWDTISLHQSPMRKVKCISDMQQTKPFYKLFHYGISSTIQNQPLLFRITEKSVEDLSPQSMVTTIIDHLFTCGAPNDKHHQIYHNNQR
eukprot:82710_1